MRRRDLLSGLTAMTAAPAAAAPNTTGLAPDLGERIEAGIRAGLLRDLHAVLVVRDGRVAVERYWPGADEAWGRSLGTVAHGPDTLHDLRSVTKSVVGLLYGIALARGAVPPPEAPLLAQFPGHPDAADDPRRARQTVGHVLTMSLGTAWNEQLPYTDPANSEIAMERAADRVGFVLSRPMEAEPGTRWTYSGGATALLGALIAQGTGRTLPDFAREALFDPLGIARFEWAAGQDGVASAASGLRLSARDLTRIGRMVLDGGTWEGRQVVPRDWLETSFAPSVPTGDGLMYGRHWYLGRAVVPALGPAPQPWAGAFGNGGQRLWVMPAARLTLVVFAGAYNAPEAWVAPSRIWREIVLAGLRG